VWVHECVSKCTCACVNVNVLGLDVVVLAWFVVSGHMSLNGC